MNTKQNYLIVASILLFLIGWSLLLYHISPTEIIDYLGTDNALIITFMVSLIGGFSSFTSGSYYGVIITFASGGVNPVLIGLCAGIGLTLGDSLVYYLGTRGHDILKGRLKKWSDHVSEWINNQHEQIVQLFAFAYTGLTPLPNDLLTASLGLANFSFRRFLPVLLAGNITMAMLLAEFSSNNFIKALLGVS